VDILRYRRNNRHSNPLLWVLVACDNGDSSRSIDSNQWASLRLPDADSEDRLEWNEFAYLSSELSYHQPRGMLRVKSWYHIALIHSSTHHHIHPLVQLYQLFVVLKEKFFLKDQIQ